MPLPLGLQTIGTLNIYAKVACLPLAVAKVLASLVEHHQTSPQSCLPALQKSCSGRYLLELYSKHAMLWHRHAST